MFPFHLAPGVVFVLALVVVVLLAIAVWVALRDDDDER